MLARAKNEVWDQAHDTSWGHQTFYWVVSKTYQHGVQHLSDILRIAMLWDHYAQHESTAKREGSRAIMTKFIDLSHKLKPDMPSYPGLMEPKFHTWLAHEESARRGNYAPGTTFQMATYEIGGNTGTYIDAPFHRTS